MTNKEAAIWLLNLRADIGKSQHSELWHYEQALQEIEEILESDVPEKKVGKWIDAKPRSGRLGKICSCCENEAYWDSDYGQQLFGWCPWCGAEMKG